MTPKQKRQRILEIEKDVQQIMYQLNHIEYRVESNLVPRNELPIPRMPELKIPDVFRKLWTGFLEEMKREKSPQ